jgi:hypothetical protein
VVWTGLDSLALSRRLQASIGQSVRLRHFTFSAPDSAGRQYTESATLLSAVTGEAYTEQTAAEVKQTAMLTEMHTGQSAEHTETGLPDGRFPYRTVAAAVVATGLALAVLRRKGR